jgi:sugar lactone lactonase YvrE
MVITPDDSTLVISESFAGRLTAFDIGADGGLSNRRVWADNVGPDGICLDADGAVWCQAADTRTHTGRPDSAEGACIRVQEGGRVLQRIEHDRAIFAATLGGADRRSLFMLAAEWRGTDGVESALAARTGQVLVVDAPAPGAGWP